MKVTVVGAGSTYTPELVSGLAAQREHLQVDELVLYDVDGARLEVVGGLAQRMLAAQGLDVTTTLTTDRGRALDGADAVLLQLRVGGQAARLGDETFPGSCDCVGQETTGAGGAAKALRTVPVVLEIAEEVRRRSAPGAWVVDFTNPVGIVTRALLDHGHRAVGLCNYAIGVQRWAARLLGVSVTDPEQLRRVAVDPAGLNHLSWTRRVLLDGEDVLPRILTEHLDDVVAQYPFPPELVRLSGTIPSYYLHYFYEHDRVVAQQRTERPRAAVVADLEAELLRAYADPSLATKPAALEGRGGAYYSEAAVDLLASLLGDRPGTHVVDVRNAHVVDGRVQPVVAGLSVDDVVEVPCEVSSAGGGTVRPLPQAPLAPEALGLVQHVTAYEQLIGRAAVTRDDDDVRRALLAHPLLGQWDLVEQLLPGVTRRAGS
ncbi:family 4 glycosyl hydrolase [Quadrisphaera setariae]|uniref:6-phospho-beta-glucosidase n=1 Tax=Quadrisphaera setariae TaxID=2593304 RepID=A0A5C8Z684_9ACTN|nr:6-phospho-beta-glucosidase [Quadrisphaera setariae]